MMSYWKLLLRSLAFYRKSHSRVVLGTMISTAILVGAFIIGDSVRFSLRRIVFARLGNTEFAVTTGDRLFRAQMAEELSNTLGAAAAPLLQTTGIAAAAGGQRRVNDVQVIGVDERFGQIGGIKDFYNNISPGEAAVNHGLASRLHLKEGDEFLLRIKTADIIPREMPLSLDTGLTAARPFKVKAVAADDRFGGFNLKADQVTPHTVFVSLAPLAAEMGYDNTANVLLIANGLRQGQVDEVLKKNWTLADIGIETRPLTGRNCVELKSNRIFLDSPIMEAALNIDPNAQPVLTYFVNRLTLGDKSTPYSFVSAPGLPIVPHDMKDGEIIVNRWLARDLNAAAGDRIRLDYYVLGPMRDLIEKQAEFRVKAVVPLAAPYADRELMPDFPGLSGQRDCRGWAPGIPIDLDKIRKKDEDYWDNYRGTPKAFVTLTAAQAMWSNRFGNLTAIRFAGSNNEDIEKKLIKQLDPADFGFTARPVKEEGLRAGSESVDFGQLFLGLSFFIIIAALLLTGLLYAFNVETRSRENGLLLALGVPRQSVRRWVFMEGAVISITGSILGMAAGVLYNQVVLYALKTVWHGAVGTSMLRLHLTLPTLSTGTAIGIAAAFFTIWLVTRKQFVQPITALQKGPAALHSFRVKNPRTAIFISISSVLAVIIIFAVTAFETGRQAFMYFFMAGALLLISGMAFIKVMLYKLSTKTNTGKLSLSGIGVRNNIRRPVRGMTLIGLLACGLFIVFTVGANRVTVTRDAEKRESGAGGFALYGESAIPVLYDLNSEKGARFYGLDSLEIKNVSYVQFRVKEGDDASCLNLNRVSTPRLIGVNPDQLARRGAFTFVKGTDEMDPENPWAVLDHPLPNGAVPAVADQTVILWGLGKAVGDRLTYKDENGKTFDVKLVGGLANSIFQGSIIISETAFIQKYPSISGYRRFLIDVPVENAEELAMQFSRLMQDQGMDVVPAPVRLAEFNRVENTYLAIFLILGGLGLILGSIAIGIVVWRNVTERQGELALLRAVGFSGQALQKMVAAEHIALLAAGMVLGICAALLATLPSIMTPGAGIPYITILVLSAAVIINGVGWTYFAARASTSQNLLASLKNE